MAKEKWEMTPEKRRENNLLRKAALEKKKRKTEELNAQTSRRHSEEIILQNSPLCLVYFINEKYEIIQKTYLNCPEQAAEAAQNIEAKLSPYDAGFVVDDFSKKVLTILSKNNMIGTEMVPQTFGIDQDYLPGLIIKGPKKHLDALDHLLVDHQANSYKETDLRSGQPKK